MSITPLYAALLILILVVLSVRVVIARRKANLLVGTGDDKPLLQASRAQGNCVEYAPAGILLILLTEMQGAPAWVVHAFGIALVTGRLLHAIGFSQSPQILILRQIGMALTLPVLVIGAIGLLIRALFTG